MSGMKPVIMDMSRMDIVASWSPRYLDRGRENRVSLQGLSLDEQFRPEIQTSEASPEHKWTFKFREHFPKMEM